MHSRRQGQFLAPSSWRRGSTRHGFLPAPVSTKQARHSRRRPPSSSPETPRDAKGELERLMAGGVRIPVRLRSAALTQLFDMPALHTFAAGRSEAQSRHSAESWSEWAAQSRIGRQRIGCRGGSPSANPLPSGEGTERRAPWLCQCGLGLLGSPVAAQTSSPPPPCSATTPGLPASRASSGRNRDSPKACSGGINCIAFCNRPMISSSPAPGDCGCRTPPGQSRSDNGNGRRPPTIPCPSGRPRSKSRPRPRRRSTR